MKHSPSNLFKPRADVVASEGHGRRVVALACLCSMTTLLLAACGSASTTPAATGNGGGAAAGQAVGHGASSSGDAVTVVQRKVVHAKVAVAKTNLHYAPAKITRSSKPASVQRPKAGTGGAATNDDNPAASASRADTGGRPTTRGVPNPCVLVSKAQAHAFIGKAVTVTEAPLGPTCIYQAAGVKLPVTMAVQRQSFTALKAHIKRRTDFTVARRPAYCGVYGTAVTYVSLSGSRVLSVSAPCPVGAKFAAAALTKLGY